MDWNRVLTSYSHFYVGWRSLAPPVSRAFNDSESFGVSIEVASRHVELLAQRNMQGEA
jgi:hypothetical protein